jgi:class 3 adenylate cyclase
MSCGEPLATTTPMDDERHSRLASAAPAPLVEKVREAANPAGERRVVTALFADVVGSTSLAEMMDAEDWTSIMNRAFDRFSPIIYRYEGTIARLLGDALLAFFGAPVAHEDDPLRAAHAALEMLAATREYAAEVKQQYGIEFAIRVGLNTGPVVVGAVGSDLKYEYTAMGDAVNLAARMQSAARPMTALASENTYRFVAPVVDTTDLGQIDVKGKSEPVQVFEITGIKSQPGRLRGLTGLSSPMVGRETELDLLLQASSFKRGDQVRGHIAVIIGEPGLGKSRLLGEWKIAITSQETKTSVQFASGYCLSYGQGIAYHLLVDLVRSLLGLSPATGDLEMRSVLRARIHDLLPESANEIYPFLGHLFAIQLEDEALVKVHQLDPQSLQGQYLAALKQLLVAICERHSVALILEDVHWADPSSTELLTRLMPLVKDYPILFCIVTRPDQDAPGWKLITTAHEQFEEYLTEIFLSALSENESRALVSNLLEIESLPEQIRTVILKKAEGNPFFVEEVIRMLIDRGAIIKQGDRWAAVKEIENVEIPDNLQGLLLARIDRLPDDVKQTLRVASVIGRQFAVKVLEHVLDQ